MSKRFKILSSLVFIILFIVLMALFAGGLNNNPKKLASTAVGKVFPNQEQINFQLEDLQTGKAVKLEKLPQPPYLLNVWGTWCPACHIEHAYLLNIAEEIPIIGIDWPAEGEQERDDAIAFLRNKGNPYQAVFYDKDSQLIVDLGVYGAPETFLIGKNQRILKRYAGPLSQKIWGKEFKPLLNTKE